MQSAAPELKPVQGNSLQVTARLLRRFLPGEAALVILGMFLVLCASGAALLQPWPLKLVVDSVVGQDEPPRALAWLLGLFGAAEVSPTQFKLRLLLLLCLGLLVIELLLGAFNVLSAYLLNSVALRLVFKLRCTLFDHVQRLSLGFHEGQAVGDSLYRITWDSYCLQAIFSEGLIPALTAGSTLLGIAAVMISRDWRLALAVLAVALPLLLLTRRLDKPMTEQSTRVHEFESEVSSRVQETLVGIRAVQAYGREQFESERFRTKAMASLQASLRLTVVQTAAQALVGLVLAAGAAAVIWLAAQGVFAKRMSAGDLVLLATYAAMIFKPLETLAYTAGAMQSAAAGARRVLAVLDSVPEVAEAEDAIELPERVLGRVEFEGVCFGYQPGQRVLRSLDLDMPANSSLALVGPSGTGKTTLASLLLRFYDPSEGRITLDGQDLRRVTLASLRHNVALVTQDPILFAASVRENIAYGRPGATVAQIHAAAQAAGAHEFILRLPEGYDTPIAERGTNLSGGQRQRIAIARAFLKDAPVLILDEPTSALDVETEEALLQALEHLMQGRTTLIIAHRLSTVRCADRIVVMKEGQIVESGSHAELLARDGLYAHLHQLQAGPPGALAPELRS
jgi:ATP-binding cassette subfamily B protein/subfamily B ATP-binding cassette protein MsbA